MNKKTKPLEINVSKFINANKPITLNQLVSIQKQMVSNMVIIGKNAESIYDFVKETNKIKRHLKSDTLSKVGRKRILDLLNVDGVHKEDGKYILKIAKPRITKHTKTVGGGGSFDKNILKKLEKLGLIKKSIKKLIQQRQKNIKTVTLDESNKNIIEILDSFSNSEKYFKDIQRLCFDYLTIWFETYEEYLNWRQSVR